MRKLRRMIALITVAMFLLSLAAPAGALAASKEDAFYRLNGLSVAFGDQNGDPMYDKNYTRAEAAALMVQLSGMGAAIDAAKGATKFSDVPGSHWASGVINLAVGAGIIKGYPNGTYKPEAPVTYAEMCAMLIQVLGYGPKLQGTWPANVIGKAAELDLLDGVSVSSYNDPAVRGMVFIAANNALDTNILEEDKDGYVEGGKLIEEKFDSAVYDEVDALVTDWDVDTDGQFTLDLTGDDPTTTAVETAANFTITLAKKVVVEGGISASLVKGHLVNFIYNTEDDEATYIDLISTKIKSDDVKTDGTDKLKINGTSYKLLSGKTLAGVGYTEDAQLENEYYNVFVDGDNKIYKVVTDPNAAAVDDGFTVAMVEEVKADKTIKYMKSGSVDCDKDDVLVVKDNKIATLDAVKTTDVVYVKKDTNGLDVYVEAYSTSQKAKFEAAYNPNGRLAGLDQVKIGSKKYDLSANVIFSTDGGDSWTGYGAGADLFDDLYNEDVTFALNKSGDVAFIMSNVQADTSLIYGVVEDFDYSIKDVVTSIELMTSAGTITNYDVNTSEIDLNTGLVVDVNGDSVNTDADDTVEESALVKVTLDANGKIDDYTVITDVVDITNANKDIKKLYYNNKWYYTTNDTKIINANGSEDAEVIAVGDFLDEVEDGYDAENAYVKLDGNNVKFILFTDDALDITAKDKALLIDKYISKGKYYGTVDIRGTVNSYELENGLSDYNALTEEFLYEYSMEGTKVDLTSGDDFDYSVDYDVYGEITDIDEATKSIEISDEVANLSVDADTYIYDMTGDDPVYVSDFSKINDGDCLFVAESTEDDRDGVADWIFIVDEDDFAGKNFETGYVK